MKVVVFHGSPRKGNTYIATRLFMDGLSQCGEVSYSEFFLPEAIPEFCMGCQLCLSNSHEKCPHSSYIEPIFQEIMDADALVFTTPHYGACSMTGGMKNLLDHLDFLTLTVAPRKEIFNKKAFVLSTGTGSTAAIKPIKKYLKNWGINRVSSIGIRMFIDKWNSMPIRKRRKQEKRLCHAARKFFFMKKKIPYISSIFMYHINRFI
ncbi:MAG: NAD(P)H-dependent oxidoreductase [Oscillospiraceae bacterium]|nr:NAD(P)H-dependent oxidoreductase [Oscillospiraceae bacterium]